MIGLTIIDRGKDGTLLPSLRDILVLLEPQAQALIWIASNVESVGPEADVLHGIADQNSSLTFAQFVELASGVDQIIDGEFVGYDSRGTKRLVVRAVDSSAFDVESDDEGLVRSVQERFSRTQRYEP